MGYVIAFSIGVVSLIVSLYLFSESVNLIKTGNRTIAVVEQLNRESGRKGKSTYRPIFRFMANGKEIHYPYKIASSPPDWEIGEKVTIIYRTDDPENPMVLTYFGAFGWAVISLVIAISLLVISGGNYLFKFYVRQFLL